MTRGSTGIAGRVAALVSRERWLVSGVALMRLSGLLAALVLVAVLALPLEAERSTAAAVSVLLLSAGSFILVVGPALLGWRAAGDVRRQARRVEALSPELRGRLLVAVERVDGPRAGESAEIVAEVVKQAEALAARVPPDRVHPSRGFLRSWAGSSGVWALALAAVWVVPGGPEAVLRYWLGSAAVAMVSPEAASVEVEGAARVGDLTLRYIYPDYTGLEPYEVVNSTGEARAVPGTRVEVVARSATPIESAALVAYTDAPLEAEVRDGRMIRAAFVIQPDPGSYRLLTYEAGETRRSREFPIVPEADLAPEVTLQAESPTLEVPVDQWLDLPWHARDDFGVSRVAVLVDGKEAGADLRRPESRVAEVGDVLHRRPIDLGMAEGGTYELSVAAWDNDTVSGSKRGQSGVIRIVVLGADGLARVTPQQRQELLRMLVDVLGDHLEEPFPPGTTAAELARWGEAVNARYQPVVAFLEGFRSRRGRLVADFRPADIALEAGRALIRFTQVAFVPESAELANADSVQMVKDLRVEAIATLEDGILAIDRLMRMAVIREVAESTSILDEMAQRLTDMLARPDVRPDELAAMAEDTEGFLSGMEELAEQLDEGGLKGFVQMHASEVRSLVQAAQEALGQQQLDEAKKLLSRASDRMGDMSEGITAELQRRQEQAKQQQGNAKSLVEKLKELVKQQDELAGQVQQIRDQLGAGQAGRLAELWKRVVALAGEAEEGARSYQEDLMEASRPFQESELTGWAVSELEETRRGAEIQDLTGTRSSAEEAAHAWAQYARRFQMLSRPDMPGPTSSDMAEVRADINTLMEAIEQLRRADAQVDPALATRLQELQDEQQALEGQLTAARQEAKQVAEDFPVRPRGMEQALQKGDERMLQASEELGRGAGMQAQGSQQAASMHIREAIESLEDAMSQARRASQEMQPQDKQEEGEGQGGEEKKESEGGEGDESGNEGRSRPFELPEPEEFRTPEAYRQALLEGMAADVPEEYRALKRRYYEELVHQ
jgi:hypothetical protein